jgi:hypothetical protein
LPYLNQERYPAELHTFCPFFFFQVEDCCAFKETFSSSNILKDLSWIGL